MNKHFKNNDIKIFGFEAAHKQGKSKDEAVELFLRYFFQAKNLFQFIFKSIWQCYLFLVTRAASFRAATGSDYSSSRDLGSQHK